LQHRRQHAGRIDGVSRRVVVDRVHLGGEQDLLLALHDLVEGAHGLFAADKQRHDHVRKDDDVSQRQDREDFALGHDAYFPGPS